MNRRYNAHARGEQATTPITSAEQADQRASDALVRFFRDILNPTKEQPMSNRASITGIRGWRAWMSDLPPVAERPNPDTVASLARWHLEMPNSHPFWDRWVILTCSLADFPGVPPAKKEWPEATHELSVWAINPDFPAEEWAKGGVSLLHGANHVVQFVCKDDAAALMIAAFAAEAFVCGRQVIEPEGVHGAREIFTTMIRQRGAESLMPTKDLTA